MALLRHLSCTAHHVLRHLGDVVLTVVPNVDDLREFVVNELTQVFSAEGSSLVVVIWQVDRWCPLGDVVLQEGLGGSLTLL